jgi:hypothetical protein
LERGLVVGVVLLLVGVAGAIISFVRWQQKDFGSLDFELQLRIVVPSALALVLGSWAILSSFLASILGFDKTIKLG